MNRPKIVIQKTDRQVKIEQRQSKVTALESSRKQNKLTLEDIYEQNQIIIEQQEEILQQLAP